LGKRLAGAERKGEGDERRKRRGKDNSNAVYKQKGRREGAKKEDEGDAEKEEPVRNAQLYPVGLCCLEERDSGEKAPRRGRW